MYQYILSTSPEMDEFLLNTYLAELVRVLPYTEGIIRPEFCYLDGRFGFDFVSNLPHEEAMRLLPPAYAHFEFEVRSIEFDPLALAA